jgi:hypothetical protein
MFFIGHDDEVSRSVTVVERSLENLASVVGLNAPEMSVNSYLESEDMTQSKKEKGQDEGWILTDDDGRPLAAQKHQGPTDAGGVTEQPAMM